MGGIPFSVLDLAPVKAGGSIADALRETLDLARHAEGWGYRRFWLAEHHNMTGIASAATAILIEHVAHGTETIRVGSGGVMLPNHAPLVIAEQFGTLASLHPGRIDLGLGRAPGTDQLTMRALRRTLSNADEDFPRDVAELLLYFAPARPGQAVRAVPGEGLRVPVLAPRVEPLQRAARGPHGPAVRLRLALRARLADAGARRLQERVPPLRKVSAPYAMACVNAFAADTDAEARRLFTSLEQAFINLRRGQPGPLPPPLDEKGRAPVGCRENWCRARAPLLCGRLAGDGAPLA